MNQAKVQTSFRHNQYKIGLPKYMKISIVGSAVTITCSNVARSLMDEFMSDKGDIFADLHDHCENSFVVQGVFEESAQVFVDGESWNDRQGVLELMNDFPLVGEPLIPLLDPVEEGTYWVVTCEFESGSFLTLEVDDFDETKLLLSRRVIEMPNGDEYRVLSASYAGTLFNYDDPEIEKLESFLFDCECNELDQ